MLLGAAGQRELRFRRRGCFVSVVRTFLTAVTQIMEQFLRSRRQFARSTDACSGNRFSHWITCAVETANLQFQIACFLRPKGAGLTLQIMCSSSRTISPCRQSLASISSPDFCAPELLCVCSEQGLRLDRKVPQRNLRFRRDLLLQFNCLPRSVLCPMTWIAHFSSVIPPILVQEHPFSAILALLR